MNRIKRVLQNIKIWRARNRKKLLFFLVFFLFIGLSSIWIPALVYGTSAKEVSIGLLTVALAFISSTAEKTLALLKEGKKDDGMDGLYMIIALVAPLLSAIAIIAIISKGYIWGALISSIAIYLLTCFLWWYQNKENKTLSVSESTTILGGNDFTEWK